MQTDHKKERKLLHSCLWSLIICPYARHINMKATYYTVWRNDVTEIGTNIYSLMKYVLKLRFTKLYKQQDKNTKVNNRTFLLNTKL